MKQHTKPFLDTRTAAMLLVAAAVLGPLRPAAGATFTEPSTVVYGRVFGVGSERPFLVSEGELEWTIRRADGKTIVLKSSLYPANKGVFSYRLDVPHEALAPGLTASDRSVTLASAPSTNVHLAIRVDGEPATILGPAGPVFDADQLRRAATYRMDLMLNRVAPDSDGDGIPDWWEDLYGLDSQDSSDADLDPNGDGLTHRDCYRNGLNPALDARIPVLQPAELRAYRSGWTGIRVDCGTAVVAPSNIVLQVRAIPRRGDLLRRNAVQGGAENSDLPMGVGDLFTRQDVLDGRIVYVHTSANAAARSDAFALALAGSPETESVPFKLTLVDAAGAAAMNFASMPGLSVRGELSFDSVDALSEALSRDMDCVIWDASTELNPVGQAGGPSAGLTAAAYAENYIPAYGADHSVVMRGGIGADHLEGGKEADILIGGPGDDILDGQGGGDLYAWLTPLDGSDTVAGFATDEDTLDISRLLTGPEDDLTNFVSLVSAGTDSRLVIRPTGAASDPDPMTITVEGTALAGKGLFDAVEDGNLRVGSKTLAPRVSLEVVSGAASENGPTAADLIIHRRGSSKNALTIGLQLSGTAGNGTDYVLLPSAIAIPAGETSVSLSVLPYVDAVYEETEYVQLTLLPGTGYSLVSASATITIEDLLPQITVTALKPLAVQNGPAGVFSIRRAGVMNAGIYVNLDYAGTAVPGTDYPSPDSYDVFLAPNVAEARISIAPLASADLTHGKSLVLNVTPDSQYKAMVSSALMMLVKETNTLARWRDRYFPGETNALAVFALNDNGETGVRNIYRYAYGLDPAHPEPAAGLPRIVMENGTFGVAFRRPASVMDIRYRLMVSDDLVTWSSVDMEQAPPPEGTNDPEIVYFRSKRPLSGRLKQFILIHLETNP